MALDDGREKFQRAAEVLAEEKDRIKDRLLIAYASQLSLINVNEDLPADLLNDYYELRNALSDADVPFGSGERAAQKIHALNEDEASAWAREIFSMFLRLCGLESKQPAS